MRSVDFLPKMFRLAPFTHGSILFSQNFPRLHYVVAVCSRTRTSPSSRCRAWCPSSRLFRTSYGCRRDAVAWCRTSSTSSTGTDFSPPTSKFASFALMTLKGSVLLASCFRSIKSREFKLHTIHLTNVRFLLTPWFRPKVSLVRQKENVSKVNICFCNPTELSVFGG